MTGVTLYRFDPLTGAFCGTTEQEQPGMFPPCTTDMPPGPAPDGTVATWNGAGWNYLPPVIVPVAPRPPKELTSLEFLLYVATVLGTGPAAIKAKITAVPDVEAIWGEVTTVERDNPATSAVLDMLIAGGQLTAPEKVAIITNWPTG